MPLIFFVYYPFNDAVGTSDARILKFSSVILGKFSKTREIFSYRQYHYYSILDAPEVETLSLNSLKLKYIIIQNLFDFCIFVRYTYG